MDTESDTTKHPIPNRYSLVVLAAKRAKQIREGAPLLIDSDSPNSLTIALEEIAAGKINMIEAVEPPPRVAPEPTVASASHGATPSALEMLDASLAEAERAARPGALEEESDDSGHLRASDAEEDADADADEADGDQSEIDSEAERDGYAGATTSLAAED